MDLLNPTFDQYFRAAWRLCGELAPLPPPLATIVADYYVPRDGDEFADIISTCGCTCSKSVRDATRLEISFEWQFIVINARRKDSIVYSRSSKWNNTPNVPAPLTHMLDVVRVGAAYELYMPGMRPAYDNAGLIKTIEKLRVKKGGLWDTAKSVIRCNVHCVRAGVREYHCPRYGVTVGDIFVETGDHEIITFHYFRRGADSWHGYGDGTSYDQWPPCDGPDCCQCKHHYKGPNHRSFGIWWVRGAAPP
jgi:hypothetical protein